MTAEERAAWIAQHVRYFLPTRDAVVDFTSYVASAIRSAEREAEARAKERIAKAIEARAADFAADGARFAMLELTGRIRALAADDGDTSFALPAPLRAEIVDLLRLGVEPGCDGEEGVDPELTHGGKGCLSCRAVRVIRALEGRDGR